MGYILRKKMVIDTARGSVHKFFIAFVKRTSYSLLFLVMCFPFGYAPKKQIGFTSLRSIDIPPSGVFLHFSARQTSFFG